MNLRLVAAILLPFVAGGLQWLLWDDWLKPYVWLLFFPAAYFSAWLGGWRGGVAGTVIGALLAWYFFIPPVYSFAIDRPASALSVLVFLLVGFLFAWFHERLQRVLRSSEARFKATFEQAAVGIALVAPDGRWLQVNQRLCDIVGYSRAELMGMTFQDITHSDDLGADLDQVRRMLAGEIDHYSMEKRYLRKEGSEIWVNLTVALTWKPDASPDFFISVVEDIQERKAAELALRRERDLGQKYLDTAQTIMVALDREGRIAMINRRGCVLFGLSEQELIGRHWFETCLPQPEGFEQVYPVFQRVMRGELDAVEYFENEVLCRDGQRRLVAWHNAALFDAEGRITGTLSSGEDISERRQADLELKHRNEELERFDRAAVGRELEMIELKRQINQLCRENGRRLPYDLDFVDTSETGRNR